VLVELFWPEADPESGRHNLSNALSSLRVILEPVGVISGSIIEADRFNVGLNPRSVSTDAWEFEETINRLLLDRSQNPELIHPYETALSMYQGSLLPGFYEDWVTPESVRLDSLYKQGTTRLTDLLLAEGKNEKAVHWAQLGLKNDPLDEGSILVLMTALERLSRYSDAIRAYRRFSEMAAQESLASPSKVLQNFAIQIETRALDSNLELPYRTDRASDGLHKADFATPQISDIPVTGESRGASTGHPNRDFTDLEGVAAKSTLKGDEFFLRTMTRFFGRQHEMAKLAKMLTVPRTRLVTITGPGGIGKTRFALEAIADIAEGEYGERNPFAAVFVNLSDVSDPSKLFGRIADSLSGAVQEGEDPRDAVVRMLDDQPSPILILDNFEQLVENSAIQLRTLLAKSQKLRLLVTSRQRLRLDGEQVFTLTPLAMPTDAISLDNLSAYPSVGLYIDRAEAASVDFQVNDKNIASICRLCATLEGVPLAIELAAARVSIMSTAHILAEVEKNRLDFLTVNSQDLAPRQQTIRATLNWSFKLLKEESKRLLSALSVFRGGWTTKAAQAISGLEIPVLESILTELRDFSLITVSDNEDGLRFSMSEVIREFAIDECIKRGELDEFARLHANYYAAFAEETIPGFLTSEGLHILQRFRDEEANLLATRTWADSNRNDPINTRIGITIIRFWLSVNWDDGDPRHDVNTTAEKRRSIFGLLMPLGGPMENSTDPDEVSGYLQQLADLCEESGTTEATGWILVQLGYTNLGRDLAFARAAAEKGVALMRKVENDTALAHALNALAVISSVQGEYDRAVALNQESYILLGDDKESKTHDFATHTEGVIAFMAGNHVRGEACLKQNLAYARETGDPRSEFAALYILGRIYNELGRFPESRAVLEAASNVCSEGHGEISYLSGYLSCYLAYSLYKVGSIPEAVSLFKKSLFQFKGSKRTQGFSMTLFFLAELLSSLKSFKLSAQLYGASEMFRIKHGRALDLKELEWDKDLRTELRIQLGMAYEDEFAQGLRLSENDAFTLAIRALDIPKTTQ
jgi:predicted ATPase/DNA-binding SARP family transcriptional activator